MSTSTQNFIRGIDVSIFQGTIDWVKVAASGIDFTVVRASHGITGDSTFATNWAGANAANIERGAYHYFIPTDDVQAQVDLFLKTVGTLIAGDLGVALDLEDPPAWATIAQANRLPLVTKWLDAVEAALGVRPIIYCSLDFIEQVFGAGAATALGAYPLWIAYYAVVDLPPIPTVWTDWLFWQWSDTTTVPGISGNVDADRFRGTLAELRQLGVPAAAAAAAVTSPDVTAVAAIAAIAAIAVPSAIEGESASVAAMSVAVKPAKTKAKSAAKMTASKTTASKTKAKGRSKAAAQKKKK